MFCNIILRTLSPQDSTSAMVIYLIDLGGFKAFIDVRISARQTLLKEPDGCGATSLLLFLFPHKIFTFRRG